MYHRYSIHKERFMNPKNLLSLGFLLLCASVLINSLQMAGAYSQGPTISSGNNPIANFTSPCNSWDTLYTNNNAQTFMITDVIQSYPGMYIAALKVNGQYIYESRENHQFVSGLPIQPGETVQCYNNGNRITISGYYTH